MSHVMHVEWVEKELADSFSLYLSEKKARMREYNGEDLLREKTLAAVLQCLGEDLGTSSPVILASLFSKYYSRIVAVGTLYALSLHHHPLDLALPHVIFGTGKTWNPAVRLLNTYRCTISPASPCRDAWRAVVMHSVFSKHLSPLYQALAEHTGVNQALLWSNTSYSIYWHYNKWMAEAKCLEDRKKIHEDFLYVTSDKNSALFEHERNPLNLKHKTIPHPLLLEQSLLLRNRCCLRYRLPQGNNCTTCPRLSESERVQALHHYHQAASSTASR